MTQRDWNGNNKMKKTTIIILTAVILISLVVAVPQILYLATTIPNGNCGDTDANPSLNNQFQHQGSVAGIFNGDFYQNGTNQTVSGVFTDYCENSQTLIEFSCGSSFSQQYSNLAGTLRYDCSELGNYSCNQGACVPTTQIPNGWTLYDDFSSGSLNSTKWTELQIDGWPFPDQHYVNTTTQKYHFAQNSATPRGAGIKLNRTFLPGEKISYEVYFDLSQNGGVSGCFINGVHCTLSGVVPNPTPNPGSGAIGYWNGLSDVGSVTGLYKITQEFNQNNITQTIIRPDNSIIQHTYNSVSYPATFMIMSQTDSNGLMMTDFDNVYFSNSSIPQTNSSLPLVALWHFNEGNGIITLDSSGNVNTGNINGANWTIGYSGNALDFDGSNDLVTTLHTPSIDVTNSVEIEAWVRHDSSGYGTIVSKNGPYILAIYNDKVHGGVYANDGLCSTSCVTYNTWTEIDGTTNLQVGVWYKLKMKYDGSTVKVYVNDVLENSAPKVGQMPQVSQNLNIGWGDPGQNHYMNGVIDEVSIRGY